MSKDEMIQLFTACCNDEKFTAQRVHAAMYQFQKSICIFRTDEFELTIMCMTHPVINYWTKENGITTAQFSAIEFCRLEELYYRGFEHERTPAARRLQLAADSAQAFKKILK